MVRFFFNDWRFLADGSRTDFELNHPAFRSFDFAARANFGCGSSREHAAGARDYGFRASCISFSDIFHNNCLRTVFCRSGFRKIKCGSFSCEPKSILDIICPSICVHKRFVTGGMEIGFVDPLKEVLASRSR
jgi:hypothetical protein